MISSKQETQKRMLSSKQLSPKNPKFASMAGIANRSPLNKFQNKQSITLNTLSSKKQLIQTKDKFAPTLPTTTSPRNSTTALEPQIAKKGSYRQNGENNKNVNAEYNSRYNQNSLPERKQPTPKIFRPQPPLQILKKDGSKSLTLPNGDIYTGDIVNGKYQGQGQYLFKTYNLLYKGAFQEGKQHGHGILTNLGTGESVYEGGWDLGAKHGNGNYNYSPDQYYNGDWINDQKQGNGFYAFSGGSYNGQWSKNRASGRGNMKLSDGTEFKGKFQNNQFLQGTVKYPNGDQYYGEMKNNLRNSEDSSYINLATKIRYKGGYLNDKKHGKGTVFYQIGDELTGIFRDGIISQNQVVSYKWADGTIFQGWFKEGKPHKGTVTWPNGQKGQI